MTMTTDQSAIKQSAQTAALEDFQLIPGGIHEEAIVSWGEIEDYATERRMFAIEEDCGLTDPTSEQLQAWAIAYVGEYNRLYAERAK